MGLFDRNNRKGGLMDEIRCDEPSYLIWKWHPSGVQQGETVRENSIRWGSSLRVKDGEVAVFVYKQILLVHKIIVQKFTVTLHIQTETAEVVTFGFIIAGIKT